MKQSRTRHEMDRYIIESNSIEISLNNEGHPFYTDHVKKGKRTGKSFGEEDAVIRKMQKAVAALEKYVPGGTWSITVDGTEV